MIKSFGQLPTGKRLARVQSSPNYKDKAFQNVYKTEMLAKEASYPKMLRRFFFESLPDQEPSHTLQSVKVDLKKISKEEPSITWFGHSSYLLMLNGKSILVDPVFERASPFQYVGSKPFPVSSPYTIEDFPALDLVIITHDHYDHLSYNAILQLRSKVPLFVTSLGVGAHLEFWGVDPSKIREFARHHQTA